MAAAVLVARGEGHFVWMTAGRSSRAGQLTRGGPGGRLGGDKGSGRGRAIVPKPLAATGRWPGLLLVRSWPGLQAAKRGWSADNPDMTSRCSTCGRFVGACRECGARYCKRCQPMQHEHGWEPERRQKQARRHGLRRLLAGRLRPLWLPQAAKIGSAESGPGRPGRSHARPASALYERGCGLTA
jgi:hypothetical protein